MIDSIAMRCFLMKLVIGRIPYSIIKWINSYSFGFIYSRVIYRF